MYSFVYMLHISLWEAFLTTESLMKFSFFFTWSKPLHFHFPVSLFRANLFTSANNGFRSSFHSYLFCGVLWNGESYERLTIVVYKPHHKYMCVMLSFLLIRYCNYDPWRRRLCSTIVVAVAAAKRRLKINHEILMKTLKDLISTL